MVRSFLLSCCCCQLRSLVDDNRDLLSALACRGYESILRLPPIDQALLDFGSRAANREAKVRRFRLSERRHLFPRRSVLFSLGGPLAGGHVGPSDFTWSWMVLSVAAMVASRSGCFWARSVFLADVVFDVVQLEPLQIRVGQDLPVAVAHRHLGPTQRAIVLPVERLLSRNGFAIES